MLLAFLVAFGLWLLVFVLASVASSLVYRRSPRWAGGVMGLASLLVATPLALHYHSLVLPSNIYALGFALLGFVYSLLLNWLFKHLKVSSISAEVLHAALWEKVLILLLLAPLGEEMLNRGLVEGYLLPQTVPVAAIIFAAVLFALPHAMAFERGKWIAVLGAFFLGLFAGWAYLVSGIVGAYVLHASGNLAGLVVGRASD